VRDDRDSAGEAGPGNREPASLSSSEGWRRPAEPAALESIPWRDRLSTQLLGFAGVLLVAAVIAFSIVEMIIARQRLSGVTSAAEVQSETITSAMRHAMMGDERDVAYAIMDTIARQGIIDHVRLINKEGRITFSTLQNERGRQIDKRAEGCRACHSADETLLVPVESHRARVYDGRGHRVLAVVTPIRNEAGCSTAACHAHPPERQVLGVLDVGYSLGDVDAALSEFRRFSLLVTAVASLAIAAFFWYFAHKRVVRPVEALVQATRRVAHDQLDTEIHVEARGELGLLAASFNEMVRALRQMEREVHQLTDNLEHKVAERTAELTAAHETLVRTEKMSSLGKLSASIAHEINNPLAGILTFAKLMIRTIEQGPVGDAERKTLVRQLALVQRETERCSAIVRNLLDFARERPLALKEVNVNLVVDEVFSLISNQTAMQNVEMVKDLAPLPTAEADFGQLRQAFVNIAMNAIEAMPKGGHLWVTTRPLPEEDSIEIVFQDDGPGVPPELMQKIFDPFFTTKEKGTGLGLSVVYGIVERHKGRVSVESEPGKGTRFTIRLPVAKHS